jgi:NADH:ubiquinone reductase (non-electrogenic)
LTKIQASVESVDLKSKTISCRATIKNFNNFSQPDHSDQSEFNVSYDKLILAPGCVPNTFGTPGVEQHALFLKNVQDAQALRARILDMFEMASLPNVSHERKKEVLHVAIVGGGPTGVELAAEIDDLFNQHLYSVYPSLKGLGSITIHDVAPQILGAFGKKLSEYALESFQRRDDVKIKTGSHITKVESGALHTKEDGVIPCGVLVWATGNKVSPLVEDLKGVKRAEKMPRILTDERLRVLKDEHDNRESAAYEGVYALGDAADVDGYSLPMTAEVAVQKAQYLSKILNSNSAYFDQDLQEDNTESGVAEFKYNQKSLVAYLGRHDGIVEGDKDWTGQAAWLAWRGGSLEWTRSWRRRVMIYMNWAMNYLDGREISRR